MPPMKTNDVRTELSAYGLRSEKQNPVLVLISSIWEAYKKGNMLSELTWQLRTAPGISPHDSLVSYLRIVGPKAAVRDLILSRQLITEQICKELWLPIESVVVVDEDHMTNRILWKMGFAPPQFEDFYDHFESRLSIFNETVLSLTPIKSEGDREKIRAAGVNLFVSVEEFIDLLLSYNIWILGSNHFIGTKFIFDINQARKTVHLILGPTLYSDGIPYSWQTSGENSLGVLLRYLMESMEWMNQLSEKNRDDVMVLEKDLPHFSQRKYKKFPFRHTQLWADADLDELKKYVQGYCNIATLINLSNVAFVRNSIDHKREATKFPDGDMILACVARIRTAFEMADIGRYVPKVYWLKREQNDRFGLIDYELIDYKSRLLILQGPMMVSGVPKLSYKMPWLIAPGNLIGEANSYLFFIWLKMNEYGEYWKDYPRRRNIPQNVIERDSELEADSSKNE